MAGRRRLARVFVATFVSFAKTPSFGVSTPAMKRCAGGPIRAK